VRAAPERTESFESNPTTTTQVVRLTTLPLEPLVVLLRFVAPSIAPVLLCKRTWTTYGRNPDVYKATLTFHQTTKERRGRLRPHAAALVARMPALNLYVSAVMVHPCTRFAVSTDGAMIAVVHQATVQVVDALSSALLAKVVEATWKPYADLCFSRAEALLRLACFKFGGVDVYSCVTWELVTTLVREGAYSTCGCFLVDDAFISGTGKSPAAGVRVRGAHSSPCVCARVCKDNGDLVFWGADAAPRVVVATRLTVKALTASPTAEVFASGSCFCKRGLCCADHTLRKKAIKVDWCCLTCATAKRCTGWKATARMLSTSHFPPTARTRCRLGRWTVPSECSALPRATSCASSTLARRCCPWPFRRAGAWAWHARTSWFSTGPAQTRRCKSLCSTRSRK